MKPPLRNPPCVPPKELLPPKEDEKDLDEGVKERLAVLNDLPEEAKDLPKLGLRVVPKLRPADEPEKALLVEFMLPEKLLPAVPLRPPAVRDV